jgi:hypothetical protein
VVPFLGAGAKNGLEDCQQVTKFVEYKNFGVVAKKAMYSTCTLEFKTLHSKSGQIDAQFLNGQRKDGGPKWF